VLFRSGGLVKAYGGGVQQALKQLAVVYKVPQVVMRLECDYAQLTSVENLLQHFAGQIIQSEYGANVCLELSLPATCIAELQDKLRDTSRGALQLHPIE